MYSSIQAQQNPHKQRNIYRHIGSRTKVKQYWSSKHWMCAGQNDSSKGKPMALKILTLLPEGLHARLTHPAKD
jgi:hypothetical protein